MIIIMIVTDEINSNNNDNINKITHTNNDSNNDR